MPIFGVVGLFSHVIRVFVQRGECHGVDQESLALSGLSLVFWPTSGYLPTGVLWQCCNSFSASCVSCFQSLPDKSSFLAIFLLFFAFASLFWSCLWPGLSLGVGLSMERFGSYAVL